MTSPFLAERPVLARTPLALDHLAVAAPSVEAGVAHVRSALGVDVPPGGAHPLMGTHNHLMRIGDACFLEIIAIDPDAPAPDRPRWFDLDRRGDAPSRLEHWLLGTPDLDATLTEAGELGGEAIRQTRGTLSWRISVPGDGSLPMGGAFPSFLQWPVGPHPAERMADLGCRLVRLDVEHPEAGRIAGFLDGRLDDDRVRVSQGTEARLRATFETPSGTRVLG